MRRTFSNLLVTVAGIVTLITCVAYLSTILLPYIDTGKYWYISVIGLGFTILFFGLLLMMFFWIFRRSKVWIICLVVLLLGFQQIRVAFGFNWPQKFELKKNPANIRVLQWNVHNWNQIQFENERHFKMGTYPEMMGMIKKYDADVLCFEEFLESTNRKKLPSNIATLNAMGYDYFYFLNDGLVDNYYAGIAIFSRYPIVESGDVSISKSNTNPLAYADIKIGGKIIRVISLHLQSVEFRSEQYQNISNLKKAKKPNVQEGKTIVSKLKRGFQRRYDQAVAVNRQIENSPYPVIVCGDFNDVPNSGTYFTVTKNLQDAFLKKGTFIGRTFRFISPTLRIDYILPGKSFKVENFKLIHVPYSDHYPLVADLRY